MMNDVMNLLNTARKHNRKSVMLPAQLDLDGKIVDCVAYAVSLGGIRLKTNVKIANDTCVLVQLKNKLQEVAKVIWSREGFIGLDFESNPKLIKTGLGSIAINLN
jgi:hypothetical protein